MKKQLPSRPNLEQLRKQAKALLRDHQAANPEALARIREHHPRWKTAPELEIRNSKFALSDAQLILACEYGFPNWPALKAHVLSQEVDGGRDEAVKALLEAAAHGDLARVTDVVGKHADIINKRGGSGTRTALHFAAGGSHESVVKFLLDHGADPNIRCEGDSATPLHFAAEKGHFGIIRLLIEHGTDPIGEGDYHEMDVIGWATCFGQGGKDVVEYLTTHGAVHNIFSAVATGEVEIIRKLVAERRSDLEKRMDLANQRRRPLHLAVVKKQPGSLAALLELGANTEALDEAGLTALDQAALSGEAEMAQVLIDHSAEVRLPAAIALQRTDDIKRLLRKDPNCLKPGNRWGNLIVRASEKSPGYVIESLISAGASVDVRDHPRTSIDSTSGYTALHAAAFHGNADAASVLLKHGAKVRAREEKYSGTPAGWANYAGHAAVRDLILQGPIDIFEALDRGLTDRIAEILEREPEALNQPLAKYLNDPSHAHAWRTPLALAVLLGNADAVRVLLEHHADQTVRDPGGHTLLEIARENGNELIIELLRRDER